MIKASHIMELIRGKRPPEDILYYIQGEWRVMMYYSKFKKWLLKPHILEQIEARIRWMDKECYDEGACKLCGCETIALQCADKQCKKPCYPPMMSRRNWIDFIQMGRGLKFPNGEVWCYSPSTDLPIQLLKSKKKKDEQSL